MFAIDPHRFGVIYANAGDLVYVGGKTAVMTAHASNNNTVSLTDLTGGVAAAPAQFDFIIAGYSIASSFDVDVTVVSAGYAERADLSTGGESANLGVFTKEITGAADTEIIVGPTGSTNNAGTLAIEVWRYVDLVTPMDVAPTTATGSGTGRPNPPAITPVTPGAVIVAVGGAEKSSAPATAVFTSSDLSAFISAASDNIYDSNVGMGYFNWSGSGAMDPAQFGGGEAGGNYVCAATLALRPLFYPPLFSVIPTITSANGYFANGDTLTGVPGTHNGTHVSYQWKRDGVAIGGETGLSYTLSGSDLTHYITFSQLASNGLPASTEATSAAIGPIADPAYQTDTRIAGADTRIAGADTRIIQTRIS